MWLPSHNLHEKVDPNWLLVMPKHNKCHPLKQHVHIPMKNANKKKHAIAQYVVLQCAKMRIKKCKKQ